MAHIAECRELRGPYSAGLLAHLRDGRGRTLERARDLGRIALANGIPAAEMHAAHHESVRQILALMCESDEWQQNEKSQYPRPCDRMYMFLRSLTAASAVAAAGDFFAECMSPFEEKQCELRSSNIALRYQKRKLESDAERFTQVVYDEAMQLLAAARLAMARSAGESMAATGGPMNEVQKLLERVEEQLEACSESGLRLLGDLGAAAAIQYLARRFSASGGLDVSAETAICRLPAEIERALYNAVREALTNVVRHARASRVRIELYQADSVIYCSVWDDGIGFDVPSAWVGTEGEGSGLASIAESLRSVAGVLAIDSVAGCGTEVRVSIDQKTSEDWESWEAFGAHDGLADWDTIPAPGAVG